MGQNSLVRLHCGFLFSLAILLLLLMLFLITTITRICSLIHCNHNRGYKPLSQGVTQKCAFFVTNSRFYFTLLGSQYQLICALLKLRNEFRERNCDIIDQKRLRICHSRSTLFSLLPNRPFHFASRIY